MKRVRVKVCGLRDGETAAKIARRGADAIGLVFADSPRWVSPEQAREVTDALPPFVAAVGVFVDSGPKVLNRVADKAALHYLQLHGDEPPEIVAQVDRPVIKAFRVRDERWLEAVRRWLDGVGDRRRVAAVLLDAYKPGAHGGTGERFNWEWVGDARAVGAMDGLPPIVLSGGLDVTNVLTAIKVVQPWAVDVSSGVERRRGIKDVDKASRFITTVVDDVPEPTGGFWT
ncbi:MAG: phosphoribosylanthranilate isomerase [Planctomycetota bacterium]